MKHSIFRQKKITYSYHIFAVWKHQMQSNFEHYDFMIKYVMTYR